MLVSTGKCMDPNFARLLIFTSDTIGRPIGAVMRRGYIAGAASVMDSRKDVILHVLHAHHITGLGIKFFPFLVSGACIKFRKDSFDAAWMWERWRQGGLKFFSGIPTNCIRMMKHYEQISMNLPMNVKISYIKWANQFRAMLRSSSDFPRPMQDFWKQLSGRLVLTRYIATEFGAVFKIEADDQNVLGDSVGKVVAGADIKLSDGDEGEILVKPPFMLSK